VRPQAGTARVRLGLCCVAGGVALLLCPVPAAASFPGANGRIVFGTLTIAGRDEPCFTPSCEERRLAALDPRTGRVLSFDPCTDPVECADAQPAVSPDGRRIAFQRLAYSGEPQPGQPQDLSYLAVTGLRGERVRLLAEPAADPAWSPSGRWIAFSRDDGLYRIRADGRGLRRLVTGSAVQVDWSMRGVLVFTRLRETRRGFRTDLYSVRPDGSGLRRLTRSGGARYPSWSPDGRSLAYTRVIFGQREAVSLRIVVRMRGHRPRRIANGVAPTWSPDGTQLAFLRRGGVWTVEVEDQQQRRLYRPRDGGIESLTWRPVVTPGG
jgi:Tol biopolymer transport system component